MDRHTIDKLISYIGILLAVVLLSASAVLFYGYHFAHSQVTEQLSAQKIYFPDADSSAFKSLPSADQAAIEPYTGKQLSTGEEAKVFANHYIGVHLKNIGGGKTYSELSSDAMKDPSNEMLAAKVTKMFQGETLRGVLLNAYAFDTIAVIARYVAVGALVAGMLLVPLSFLGFRHAEKSKKTKR